MYEIVGFKQQKTPYYYDVFRCSYSV